MPPMLDVTLDELVRGRAQQMLARHCAFCQGQGHHILELVAEAISSAQLIERRASPNAAAERLIQEPTIQHQIQIVFGCGDLNRTENVVPSANYVAQDLVQIYGAIAIEQFAGSISVFRFTKKKPDFPPRARAQFKPGLQGRTWVETRAYFP